MNLDHWKSIVRGLMSAAPAEVPPELVAAALAFTGPKPSKAKPRPSVEDQPWFEEIRRRIRSGGAVLPNALELGEAVLGRKPSPKEREAIRKALEGAGYQRRRASYGQGTLYRHPKLF